MTSTQNAIGRQENADLNHQLLSLDVIGMLRRRKWAGIALFFILLIAALTVALILPPTYESTATILIEEPDVPADLVKSTVSTFAAQRLEVIQQRVMTSENLGAIIDRFGLYQTALQRYPRSQIIEGMRQNINLDVVSADLLGPQNTKQQNDSNAASIAFTLSFDYGDPTAAQQVANRLTDLYLAENSRSRQEQAAGTTEFLTQESKRLYDDVQESAQKLQDFKSKYPGSMPEQLSMNTQILNQTQVLLAQATSNLQSVMGKRAFLESQAAQLSPYQPVNAQGTPATPQAQLMALELQYVDLSSKYGPDHPDVVQTKKRIDALKQQLGTNGQQTTTGPSLAELQAQLAQAQQRYGDQHPTVVKLRDQIASLQKASAASASGAAASTAQILSAPNGPPDNPVYIQLQTQLGSAAAEARGLEVQVATLQAKNDEFEKRVLQTTAIEGEYNSLTEQYNAAVSRYQAFKDKEADAQVAQNMEQQSKGETFAVIEAPQVPDIPVKPNRKLILAAGGFLAAMFAAALMIGLELLDSKVYQATTMQSVFGELPLTTVPYIWNRSEIRRKWARRILVTFCVLFAVAGGLAYVNQNVTPLDVLYASFINRINP